ncbi:MlaC/ttg2D family ABC transporter substrate-binding protein [Microvirga sp. 2TAF3]|uniref:MlaC/ttg2D family ABC transporter substrate-binding protein n=1 Tax=Microvirga sp. 2TAF3 TaxID=3233014 RepID=UPI003F9C9920
MVSRRDLLMLIGAMAIARPLAAAGQGEDPAIAHVKAFYDSMRSVTTGARGSDPKKRIAALSQAMTRAFDIAAMTRLAVGPGWTKIPAAKRASLQEAFGRYFIATYASRLDQASGGRFEVLPNAERRAGGTIVRTQIIDAEGKATPVDYLLNPEGRIVDVYLNGTVSELASHRSEFDAALKAGGPDALESSLRKRADALSGGT